MKILVVPDIHGRDFWIEPCQKWQGSIVFLGDYHDPYPFQVSKDNSLKNLEKLVNFVTVNKDRCICLEGNHDYPYLTYANNGCRFDRLHSNAVREYLTELKLQVALIQDNIVFSHAGITPAWCNSSGYDFEEIPSMLITDSHLGEVSWYRGGLNTHGSPLWCDICEYADSSHYPVYYQIFGHSQQEKNPVIEEDYACLDCRQCFIIDTIKNTILQWDQIVILLKNVQKKQVISVK